MDKKKQREIECIDLSSDEEMEEDDSLVGPVLYRPTKTKAKKEKKQKEIECIDLSSDEETEEDDSLVEVVDFNDNHFFGSDSETEVAEVSSDDPLAGLQGLGTDEPLAFNVIYI